MSPESVERVRDSFRVLAPRGPELFAQFVARVAQASPFLAKFFPEQPRDHAQEFLSPCGLVVKNLHRLTAIEYLLVDMGGKNMLRGVEPQHYGVARDCMLATIAEALGDGWTDEVRSDWTEAIQTVTSLMIRGAGRARRKAA